MGIIRKYNTKSKEWEIVSASNASAISVRSEDLLDKGQVETNVESVLQKLKGDISTLQGNVSWLAEHGGGGSGGGGGTTTDAEIKVNGQDTGSSIVLDSNGLNIVVQAKSSSLRWNITVATNSKSIKSVNNVTKVSVTTDELTKLGITDSFDLAITAFNESSLTSVYWNGRIQIANVFLSTSEEVSCKFVDKEKNGIAYTYSVGVLGTYVLYINDLIIGEPHTFTSLKGDIQVMYSEMETAGIALNVGKNTIIARLQQLQSADIKSADCESRIIFTANEPIISCPSLSEDSNNRTSIPVNLDQDTVLLMPFTVYYTSGSFKSYICSDANTEIDWSTVKEFKTYNTTYENTSYIITEREKDKEVKIVIKIYDSRTSTEYYKEYYGKTVEPDYNLLDINEGVEDESRIATPIFNFQTFYGHLDNNQWKSDNAILTVYNPNVKSNDILATQGRILRLQNASYAVIQNNRSNSYYNDYITDVIKEFTLSVCYKADFHPDDDRTILQFASPDTEHEPSSGIIIRDHKLYVNQNYLDLEDNELMTITITYSQVAQDKPGCVFVYINGTVERVFSNIEISSLIPVNENKVYLAAQVEDGESMFYTDTSFYRVTMYPKCLSPLQVLYEYLNDQAFTHLKDNIPDSTYITEGLKRNFISTDEYGNHTSLLYNSLQDFDNNAETFNDNFLFSNLVSITSTSTEIRGDISNYIVPLPLMVIDVSKGSNWTWNNFISPNTTLNQVDGCSFQYYDQNGTNQSIIKGECSVNIQGTSTLSDAIKNLQITYSDDVVFVPKETWLPEKEYTLKADIVDSSHSLNTSIGKFVNTELGMTYNDDGSIKQNESWYPYSNTVKSTFEAAKKKTAMQKYFPKATLKHGVEGFPIFLIIRFKGDGNDTGLHSMGFYQFILGRKSPRNLGYEIINSVTGLENTTIQYPLYQTGVNISVNDNKGCWIEVGENDSFSTDFGFQEKDSISDTLFNGLFWQEDSVDGALYDTNRVEVKYNNLGDQAVTDVRKFEPFMKFVRNIISLPVTNRRYVKSGSDTLAKNTFINTTYPKYTFKPETGGWVPTKVEGSNQILDKGDLLQGVLNELDVKSYAKYFVICMFFGLIDNFEKNMPLKFYQTSSGTWEIPLLGIYDTDTACGGDNQGTIKVSESVWLSTIENVNGVLQETSTQGRNGKVTNIIGQNNKLWYFDSEGLLYTLVNNATGSLFATMWFSFLNHLKNKYNGTDYQISSLSDVVSLYYNKYFIPQTEGCGELLFNLTYFTKYLNKYEVNGSLINQSGKLNGRRQQQIKKWLNNRVKFLDSMYTAMGTNESADSASAKEITTSNVSISSGQAPTFKLTSNYPIITQISHQGGNDVFVFLDENENTSVNWGSTSASSQEVNHAVTYSDSIQKFGDDEYTLQNLYFAKVNNGNIPYLTEFNASGCANLATDEDALKCFKVNGQSELRSINLSNTAKSSETINYVINLSDGGFNKLQTLNLNSSCVSRLLLPTGENSIPFLSLDIRNSQLQQLDLESQNLLTNLDLTGCVKISSISIKNCEKLTSLKIGTTQANLNTISISSSTFESIECIDNDSVTTIEIASSSLKSVNITNCRKLTTLTISGDILDSLILSGCASLTTINITNPQTSIGTLDFSNTNIKNIQYNGVSEDETIMDLSQFKSIGSFNNAMNSSVEYIQFNNDKSYPINITKPFTNNTKLKRVYGNLNIKTNYAFAGCKSFSILGTDETYNGISMLDTNGRVKHFTEFSNNSKIVTNNLPTFQTGKGFTNLNFMISDGQYNFQNTSCTLLDVYYVFYNIGAITSCHMMFTQVRTIEIGWDEDCDNSLHKNTFINCGKITSLSHTFYDTTFKSKSRLFSPSVDSEGTVTANDGLFSPLVSLTNMQRMFSDKLFYADRYLFRRYGTGMYKITNMDRLRFFVLVDDVNGMSKPIDETNLLNNLDLLDKYNKFGNFKDFFVNLPSVSSLFAFANGTAIINFDLTGELKCPATVYQASFTSTYATGDIKLENLFKSPKNVTKIQESFFVTGGNDSMQNLVGDKATFKIYGGMLDEFSNLIDWGFRTSGEYLYGLVGCPFTGSGIARSITDTTFPTEIFNNNKNLVSIEGFFKDIDFNNMSIEFPGDMFINNNKLQSVCALFRNATNCSLKLTSDGFANCYNLRKVSHLFANCWSNIQTCIPQRFFYHGGVNRVKTYTGLDLWNDDKSDYKYDPTETDETGKQKGFETDPETLQITYPDPYKTISDMSYCFQHCNFQVYQNTNPTIENNPSYLPFTHISINGWIKKADYNNIATTFIWEFDGVDVPQGYEGENLDETHQETVSEGIQFCSEINLTNDLHFMCAPDLLRYCTETVNLEGLFYNCGYTSNGSKDHMSPVPVSTSLYGLKGRIVPYLFKPVNNITSIANMFYNCKLLGFYEDESGTQYVIPKTFFNYATRITNLSNAFLGTTYPSKVNLKVFDSLTGTLNITSIFQYCRFNGTSSQRVNVYQVFKNKSINAMQRAFSPNESTTSASSSNNMIRSQYVTFDDNFTLKKITKDADKYVFDGYTEGYVSFGTKSLDTAENKCNYRTIGNT